ALFIVNNRLDIALLTEADGIHLGNNDIPAEEARRLAPGLIIGVSANTAQQAATAEKRGASYFNIGPLFPTDTKNGLRNFIGLEAVKEYTARSSLPCTVMGGIKFDHIPALIEEGVRRIAVVTALTLADDIRDETRRWLTEIKQQWEAKTGKW
ncbi:MAG: thiamine phosphate synthase, partial [Desulfurivibrionaceae bacterium]